MSELIRFQGNAPEIEIRSEAERIVAVRLARWGDIGRTANGNERFDAGAFDRDEERGLNDPAQRGSAHGA